MGRPNGEIKAANGRPRLVAFPDRRQCPRRPVVFAFCPGAPRPGNPPFSLTGFDPRASLCALRAAPRGEQSSRARVLHHPFSHAGGGKRRFMSFSIAPHFPSSLGFRISVFRSALAFFPFIVKIKIECHVTQEHSYVNAHKQCLHVTRSRATRIRSRNFSPSFFSYTHLATMIY